MTVNVHIGFHGNVSEEDSSELTRLAYLIERECDVRATVQREKPKPGVKDGGLAIGIAIASLAVASVGGLFTALAYWKSRNPKYSILVRRGGVSETIENLDFDQYQQEFSNLVQDSRVDIHIEMGRE